MMGHEYCGAPLNLCVVGKMYIVLLLLLFGYENDDDAASFVPCGRAVSQIATIEMRIKRIMVTMQHFHPEMKLLR